jgi:cytochrome c biogenesis protein CcdA
MNIIKASILLLLFIFNFNLAFSFQKKVNVLHYFAYKTNCSKCVELDNKIKRLKGANKKFIIKYYNMTDFRLLDILKILEETLKTKVVEVPLIVIGSEIYQGSNNIAKNIKIIEMELNQNNLPDYLSDLHLKCEIIDYEKYIFSKLNLLVVISAGILDSINPCALITLFILITYLSRLTSHNKKVLFISGMSYIFTVFITYTVIGLGLLGGITAILSTIEVKNYFNMFLSMIILFFAALNLIDYFRIKKNKPVFLKLSAFQKHLIKKNIFSRIYRSIKKNNFFYIALSLIILGFFVTIIELTCTGQIYLPFIIFLTKNNNFVGYLYLILYNFIFILPLIILFMLSYYGKKIRVITIFLENHHQTLKLIYFFLLIIIGIYVFKV